MKYLCLTVFGERELEASLKEHAMLGWTLHTLTYLGMVDLNPTKRLTSWHVVMEKGI